MESAGEKEATRIAGMRMRYGNKNIIGGGLGFFSVGGICKECGRWRVSLQNVKSSPNLIVAIALFWDCYFYFLVVWSNILMSYGDLIRSDCQP